MRDSEGRMQARGTRRVRVPQSDGQTDQWGHWACPLRKTIRAVIMEAFNFLECEGKTGKSEGWDDHLRTSAELVGILGNALYGDTLCIMQGMEGCCGDTEI